MSAMRTFRLTENDIERLEDLVAKITKAAEKEGMVCSVTRTNVLRSLIALGTNISVKEVLEQIKKMKIYG